MTRDEIIALLTAQATCPHDRIALAPQNPRDAQCDGELLARCLVCGWEGPMVAVPVAYPEAVAYRRDDFGEHTATRIPKKG